MRWSWFTAYCDTRDYFNGWVYTFGDTQFLIRIIKRNYWKVLEIKGYTSPGSMGFVRILRGSRGPTGPRSPDAASRRSRVSFFPLFATLRSAIEQQSLKG